jgi:hypothetical protein
MNDGSSNPGSIMKQRYSSKSASAEPSICGVNSGRRNSVPPSSAGSAGTGSSVNVPSARSPLPQAPIKAISSVVSARLSSNEPHAPPVCMLYGGITRSAV